MTVYIATYKIQREGLKSPLAAAATAAAKLLQSCRTLCDPIDGSPLGSSAHGIFQARVLEWGAITKIMTCGPITSWQINGETMETVTDFIFWTPKSL